MDGPTVAGFQPLLVFYPRHFSEAQRIIQAVRENQVVLLVTRHAAAGEAQRLIDFACGGMEALDGQVHRIDAETFLFAPAQARVEG
jgi:cell division inhibitor SepF